MNNNIVPKQKKAISLTVSKRSDLNVLPGKPERGGHIYLIEFADKSIKIGMTINPIQRVGQHYSESHKFGKTLTRVWLSEPHANYESNETEAMKLCQKYGDLSGGREYFKGVRIFDQVMAGIEGLNFNPGGKIHKEDYSWIQDHMEAFQAQYALEQLKEMLGETPVVLLHQLGLIHHDGYSPQRLYDWVMSDESYDSYEKRIQMLDVYMRLANVHDMPIKDFLDMDTFEKTEMLIHRMVSTQIDLLRMTARKEGMDTLFYPIRENIVDAAESVGL